MWDEDPLIKRARDEKGEKRSCGRRGRESRDEKRRVKGETERVRLRKRERGTMKE
jgi:hypothetical protein